MKKFILIIAMTIDVICAMAQDLQPTLAKTFQAFDTTHAIDAKTEQSNKLTLIAKKWNNEWVTHYYAAYSKALLSYLEKDPAKRDAYLDEADKEREDAVTLLKKENDETYVLAAMIANMRMAIDPMQRWQKYGKIFTDNLESAKDENPDNPRIYYLLGTNKYHTPKNFGGGSSAAMPYFEKAAALFAKENDSDIMKPTWGKRANAYFLEQCRQGDKS